MKILFVHKQMLFPHDTGGKIRALNILRHLSRWHDVTYVCNIRRGEEQYIPAMTALGLRLESVPGEAARRGGLRFYGNLAFNLFSRRPFSVNRNYDPMVRAKVAQILEAEQYDVLICDCVQMARHVFGLRARVNILFQHNVEAQILHRHAEASGSRMRRCYMKIDWKKMRRFEAECGRQFERVIAISETDRKTFEANYGWSHVDVIDTAVDTDYFHGTTDEPKQDHLVFVGSMDWLPNQDGVRWFIGQAWPEIRRRRPRAVLKVVGRNPPADIRSLGRFEGVEIVGGVPDVRPYFKEAAVSIVPLLVGGGTRLKIFEAMAMGRPVVSTSVGAEGLPVMQSEHLLIADDPKAFADSAVRLLEDHQLCKKLGGAACHFVNSRFGSEPIARQFEAICQRVLNERR